MLLTVRLFLFLNLGGRHNRSGSWRDRTHRHDPEFDLELFTYAAVNRHDALGVESFFFNQIASSLFGSGLSRPGVIVSSCVDHDVALRAGFVTQLDGKITEPRLFFFEP